MTRSRRFATAPILVALSLLLAGCGGDTVGIHEVYGEPDQTRIEMGVFSCRADVTVEVEETDDTVRLTAHAENGITADCQDGAVVELKSPLGDRSVIDGSSGERLTVLPPH